jgi:uncharacterized protein YdaU (DUF1376 family)
MTKPKARRVDYYPDEYIAGVGGVLRADEQGVYWMICSLIMSEGEAIEQNDRRLAALCQIRPTDVRRIVETLIQAKKISRQSDGKLFQKRSQSEVEKSLKRIQTASENGTNGGRPSEKTQRKQQNGEAGGFSSEKLTTNYQPPTTNLQPRKEEDVTAEAVPSAYAFEGVTIKLNQKNFDLWVEAYPNLSLMSELYALDEWAGQQKAAGKSWFNAVAGALSKKQRDINERISVAKVSRSAGGTASARRETRI